MDVKLLKIEDAENCKKKLELEISDSEIQNKINEIFNQLQKEAVIPGFRPGHAPRKILEQRFSKQVRAQAIENILPAAYEQVLKEQNLSPISNPYVTEIKAELAQPVQVKVEFEIRPEIPLPEYINIPVEKKEHKINDDEINNVLNRLQEKHAIWNPITDKPVKEGDLLLIDFIGKIEGKKFEGGSVKQFRLELGKNQLLPDFEKGLIGMMPGNSKEISVQFPADYPKKEFANKQANFQVILHEIKEKQLSKLDDEFAKDLGEFETLLQLKEKIKSNLEIESENNIKENMKNQIIDYLLSKSEFNLPGSMVNEQSQDIFIRNEFRLKQYGLSHEQMGSSREKAAEQSLELAKKQIKSTFILDKIAQNENITVSDDELDQAIQNIAQYNNIEPEKYRNTLLEDKKIDLLRYQLRDDKVLNYLLEKAEIKIITE